MSDIVWIASYPKSGNTWMRMFLANLTADQAVGINAISITDAASSRDVFDASAGIEASDLTPDEVRNCIPDVFRLRARDAGSRLFIKAHDAYEMTPQGRPLFPADVSLGAIYLVRNPLDVAVSLAHHFGMGVERTINFMMNEEARTGADPRRLSEQLGERLTSWSSHVRSWTEQSEIPVQVVRYEDMSVSPLEVFSRAASAAQIDATPERVDQALRACSFERLKSQEVAGGFREGFRGDRPFFREGKVGSWRKSLSQSQVERMVDQHADVMARFGYLSPDRRLLV